MPLTKIQLAFHGQKQRAKTRGIPFLFTQPVWIAWWIAHLGPNWLKLRGARKGFHVMARKGDKGPYAAWNVECVLHEENAAARKQNGTTAYGPRNANSYISDDIALAIYYSSGVNDSIANRFEVGIGVVAVIRSGRSYTHRCSC